MKEPIVVVGIGNMGGVFSQAFLSIGHPVYPIILGMDPAAVARELPDPLLVLVAVTEDDLHAFLETMPEVWRDRVGLLQNEILPRDWEMHALPHPTVIAVWFEKRKTTPPMPYFPTLAYGPHADAVVEALTALDIPAGRIEDTEQLLYELVRKNLWIVTLQVSGLVAIGTIGEVWEQHRELCLEIAENVLDVQQALAGRELPRERLLYQLGQDFEGEPGKSTAGRSALGRLKRAVAWADQFGLEVPRLRGILASVQG